MYFGGIKAVDGRHLIVHGHKAVGDALRRGDAVDYDTAAGALYEFAREVIGAHE